MPIADCKIIHLPKITDPRGNLTFLEGNDHVPFSIKRVYYLYDVPGGSGRGAHAHKELHQLIVAVAGSFTITLDDGCSRQIFNLNHPYEGLYVCPMIWRNLDNFSSGAVCLVLASHVYDAKDYFRSYKRFLTKVASSR